MDTMSALLLGAVTDRSTETDECGLVLLLLRLKNGVIDALKVTDGRVSLCTFAGIIPLTCHRR